MEWKASAELIPCVVQDFKTAQVLMLGYMNQESFKKTLEIGKLTFYSRSKKRLWTKGETSGNHLFVKKLQFDCDNDTLLVLANPLGDTCHLNRPSCFPIEGPSLSFLGNLEKKIASRKLSQDSSSYTRRLFDKGVKRIAQKVGEEAVEVALASCSNDRNETLQESADLLYHLLVLLQAQDIELSEVIDVLQTRSLE